QGLYFGLGAYAMGYCLKLRSAALKDGLPFVAGPDMARPDFMAYCRLPAVPSWIAPLIDLRLALAVAGLLPTAVAPAFGGVGFGQVLTAIRDSETRVLALGYNAALYKAFVFALAGGIAGLAGALYVSALGTTGRDSLDIAFSIEVVIFVAVGGRGTLIGAVLGA